MVRYLPQWKTPSLSSGERAGVRASVSSDRTLPASVHNDFASAASLKPSPMKLKASTVTKIAAPGASNHG